MLKIHDILRAGSVKRWNMVNTIRIQTLGEHQHLVTLIALEIASRLGMEGPDLMVVVFNAMTHDSAENRTGDIPSPTKRRILERTGVDINDVFQDFDVCDHSMLPKHVTEIVKAADHVEGILFLSENRMGRHADAVYDDICTAAETFFRSAGDTGAIARQILSEVQNAVYEV